MKISGDPFDEPPRGGLFDKKRRKKKKKQKSHHGSERREMQMMRELGAAPPASIMMEGARVSLKDRVRGKLGATFAKHKKRVAVLGFTMLAGVIALVLVTTGAFTSTDQSEGKEKAPKTKKVKGKRKNKLEEKRVEFEEDQQNLVEAQERQRAALKSEFSAIMVQIQALERRSQENQQEAQQNSENYKKRYAQEKGGAYPDGVNQPMGDAFGQGFATPAQNKRSKQGMTLLAEELKAEMVDIQQEHSELVLRAQQIEQEFTARWPE